MKKLLLILAILIVGGTPVEASAPKCELSQDAKDMAIRISTVMMKTLAYTNSQEVGQLIKDITAVIPPPECASPR